MALCNVCCDLQQRAQSETSFRYGLLWLLCNQLSSGSSIANSDNFVDGQTVAMTDTADHEVIAAPGAGNRLVITSLSGTNGHASVGTYIVIKKGTTEQKRYYASPGGGGFSLALPTPIVLGENEALNAANITTGSETYVSAEGYIEAI